MKQIKVKVGEPFEIDNGRYISTWKMVIRDGILQLVHLHDIDWEKLESKIDVLLNESSRIICDVCGKEQERHEDSNTDSMVCLYCNHRIR